VASALALLGAYGAVQSQSAQAASSQVATDPSGDANTRVSGNSTQPVPNEPKADVVAATADYQATAIVLSVRTAAPVTPQSDASWGESVVTWFLDTTGDKNYDYSVEFGADAGALYADVYNSTSETAICSASAGRAQDGSYVASVPVSCLKNPNGFYWGGRTEFGPGDSPIMDRFPDGDGNYFGPITKPGATPPPTNPTTPTTRPGGGGNPAPIPTTTTTAPVPIVQNPLSANEGFWLLGRDGGVFSFGGAQFFGSIGNIPLNKQIVGIAAKPDGSGYWFVGADGGIFAYKAPFWGSTGNVRLTKPIVGMTSTPSGKGYWLVASDGGIFSFGDAGFYGSTGAVALNKPIVGMASTPSGKGYWLVASDGGIFSFGDARFFGSTGNVVLNQPIVGMSSTQSGNGYWFVAADGGIFNFGDAPFFGSAVNGSLSPVTGMAATKSGTGYRVVRADGSVLAFGSAGIGGGFASGRLSAPIVAITTAF
jgi:ribosomal protein L24E